MQTPATFSIVARSVSSKTVKANLAPSGQAGRVGLTMFLLGVDRAGTGKWITRTGRRTDSSGAGARLHVARWSRVRAVRASFGAPGRAAVAPAAGPLDCGANDRL